MAYQRHLGVASGNEAVCPVPDHMLAAIHRATPHEAMAISKLLPDAQRAQLALFCFGRSHLRDAGCAIAIACSDHDLVREGGIVGQALIVQRALPKADRRHKVPITLATPATQHRFVTHEDIDAEEDVA